MFFTALEAQTLITGFGTLKVVGLGLLVSGGGCFVLLHFLGKSKQKHHERRPQNDNRSHSPIVWEFSLKLSYFWCRASNHPKPCPNHPKPCPNHRWEPVNKVGD